MAARTFCTSGVASASGGVKVSSTTSLRPAFFEQTLAHRLDRGHRGGGVVGDDGDGLGVAAGRTLASSMMIGKACVACEPAVAEVWKTYLKPRCGDEVGVGQSEHRQVRALGHLGHGQSERAEIRAAGRDHVGYFRTPCAAPRSWPSRRCRRNRARPACSLAPPSALMPPS